jgi:hypothetical protein
MRSPCSGQWYVSQPGCAFGLLTPAERRMQELERFVTGQFQYRLKAEQAGVDCGLIDRMNTSASDFARMPLPAYQPPASFQPVQVQPLPCRAAALMRRCLRM